MKLETFFEKFELFADAPGAVGKMRELVLNFAVTGRLSEYRAGDAPVSELVDALSAAKNRRGKKGKRNHAVEFPPESVVDRPIDVPSHWAWVPLNEIGAMSGGMTPSKDKTAFWDGDINWFSSKDIKTDELTKSELKITSKATEATGLQVYSPGCIVMVARSGILKRTFPVSILRVKGTVNQDLKVLSPYVGGIERYLQIMLRGMTGFILTSLVKTGMTVQSLKYEEFEAQPFPLPPLAEQKRIVAKVDELMALCDRLEAQQQERDTRHAALARASLVRFAEAPPPANLDFLFHKSHPIPPADLRKTILTLAVQGKLVQQNPNDEPAEACLSRLGLKSTLTDLDGTDDGEGLLPPTWTRVRFEDIALVAGGVTLGRKLGSRKTVSLPYLRVANVKRGEIDLGVIKEIHIAEDEIERYALRENDLLMTEGGDWDKVGRAAIWRAQIPRCLHQNHVFRARMRSAEITPEWFERYFNSPDGRGYFESAAKQTTNLASINMRQVRSCPVPFPPLAEQRRIVAKVDQLMAWIDQLETHLTTSRAAAAKLMEAVVYELVRHSDAGQHEHVARRRLTQETKVMAP